LWWQASLVYGVSPQWFAKSFLGVVDLDRNMAHILRAIMGLSMSFAIFWLFAASSNKHRNTAVLTTLIFAAGLVSGTHQPRGRWGPVTHSRDLHAG